jgi:hypothetical protein
MWEIAQVMVQDRGEVKGRDVPEPLDDIEDTLP